MVVGMWTHSLSFQFGSIYILLGFFLMRKILLSSLKWNSIYDCYCNFLLQCTKCISVPYQICCCTQARPYTTLPIIISPQENWRWIKYYLAYKIIIITNIGSIFSLEKVWNLMNEKISLEFGVSKAMENWMKKILRCCRLPFTLYKICEYKLHKLTSFAWHASFFYIRWF